MLAIVWALQSLRMYLYGTAKVIIYTDHQPLTFALSSKNHNGKLKRWKSYLEEYNHELRYKPGTSNVVADALSRIPTNPQINSTTATVHSDESSSHNLISVENVPINVFKNQLFLLISDEEEESFEIPFPTFHRHIIKKKSYSEEDLVDI